jgi:adenylate cyclase
MKNFRITIGAKLIGLIALLLVSSIATIVYQSTSMYVGNDKENIRVSNVETTGSLAIHTREVFESLTEKMRFLGDLLIQDAGQGGANTGAESPIIRDFFDKDKDFLGVVIHHVDNGTWNPSSKALSPEFIATGDTDGAKALDAVISSKSFSPTQLAKGEPQITTFKLSDGSAAVAVGIPLVQSEANKALFSYTATAFIRPSKFSQAFSENARGASYLVDRQGNLLAHTDAGRVGENVSNLPVVKELLSGTKPQNLVPYKDPATGESRLASYRTVGFAGLGVVAELPEALAYQAANTMEHRAMLVGLVILFLAFWAGYLYSETISAPIRKLVDAAQRIASGDFKINLRVKGRDEVATLSNAFNEMAKGLEERDRVKDTFNKFHNKEIAEKLLSGEVKLGGERKEATVFFSDVRGFTAMSESMEPEQVVEMLNEYMTRMVSIIRKNHGIVDKYVGDAIMALWGVPIGGGDDIYNAVRTCLTMREDLSKLNELRISRGQSPLRIGMGLNMGPVIAGNIGSVEKMEYTVIGDTVNLASRMESMTKEYGTDFLIPKSIYDRVKDRFVFEKCKSARVKGKSTEIEIYKVRGYVDEAGREVIIETPYSSYAAEKSDKVVHDEPVRATPVYEVPEHSGLIDRTSSGFYRPSFETAPVLEMEMYFVELYGEIMGPFTELEVKGGILSREFPENSRFSETKDGVFRPLSQFGESPSEVLSRVLPVEPSQVFEMQLHVAGAPATENAPPVEMELHVIDISAATPPTDENVVEAFVAEKALVMPPPFTARIVSPPPFRMNPAQPPETIPDGEEKTSEEVVLELPKLEDPAA